MTTPSAPGDASERVLSTLNRDGTRRWLFPRLSPGRFLRWRRVVGYLLIVVYNLLPWIIINGRPSVLLDLPAREFTFFGTTFLPTDTLLLMLFIAGVFVGVFLITALFGRLWCGWACPQTVYMELVYRPIERLFDGPPDSRGRKGRRSTGLRRALKYLAFLVVSLHLAHTFLAYFVGAENLFEWTKHSPFEHPKAFIIVFATTGLMMFDFCLFREQTCIVACPYGRFQSVMLDRSSLTIGYDEKRGEPRGVMKKSQDGDVELPVRGDCVDCGLCVTTCPTGIDIREGLQMECVGCAQCIDACDAVMERIGRPRGLIRYSSQEAMASGSRRMIRPRVILYPALLAVIVTAFVVALLGQAPADVTLLRASGRPYAQLETGEIENVVRIKIVNRTASPSRYAVSVDGLAGARLIGVDDAIELDGGASRTVNASIVVPRTSFDQGRAAVTVRIADDRDFRTQRRYRLQGPWSTQEVDS